MSRLCVAPIIRDGFGLIPSFWGFEPLTRQRSSFTALCSREIYFRFTISFWNEAGLPPAYKKGNYSHLLLAECVEAISRA